MDNTKKEKNVDHPDHYGGEDNPYEVIKIIEAHNLGFHLGNTLKYMLRAGVKNEETELEDLKKGKWYLDRKIESLEKKQQKPFASWLDTFEKELKSDLENRMLQYSIGCDPYKPKNNDIEFCIWRALVDSKIKEKEKEKEKEENEQDDEVQPIENKGNPEPTIEAYIGICKNSPGGNSNYGDIWTKGLDGKYRSPSHPDIQLSQGDINRDILNGYLRRIDECDLKMSDIVDTLVLSGCVDWRYPARSI